MGNNKYFDELIASYLSKNLDAEEEAFILDWINSSEQNEQYFEEVRTIWNLLSIHNVATAINVDCEWDQFKQVISTKEKELSGNEVPGSDDEITEQVKANRKAKISKLFISAAVAASIIVVIALGWRVANNNDATIGNSLAVKVNSEKYSPASFVQSQYNTTDKVKQLVLQDGSGVRLFRKSRISFFKPFINNNRNITLVGKATFRVAKDKAKPFTVFSGDISTTALGTQFTVTAFEKDQNIIVRLYEGKVLVKSGNNAKRKLKNFYLLSGQELVYDNKNLIAKVRTFRREDNPVGKNNKREPIPIDNPSVPKLGKGSWYMFNNQPLEQVFNQLESMFNVDIVYTRKDISKIYFIGTFNITESLEGILK
ncbi:MAG TPA: FecR family protein, partial [Segetibacter sp.]